MDMQPAQNKSRLRGVGRYSTSLTTEIAKLAAGRGHEIVLALSDRFPETIPIIMGTYQGLIPEGNIQVFPTPNGGLQGNVSANIDRLRSAETQRENFIASLNPDFVYVHNLFEGSEDDAIASIGRGDRKLPTAVTLYDVIPQVLSDIYITTDEFAKYYRDKLNSLKQADILLANSQQSMQDAIDYVGIAPSKITIVSAGLNGAFRPVDVPEETKSALLAKFGIASDYILYVPGGFDPRKNFTNLFQAYAELPSDTRSTYQLVIASSATAEKRDWLLGEAKRHAIAPQQLVLTGYVTDDELIYLYNLCSVHVFPSLYEGFGLPALESMACGAPTIGSNNSSLPEVIGRPDALFDPLSPSAISKSLERALTDNAYRSSLRAHALSHTQQFSWRKTAELALDAIEKSYRSLREG